MKMRLMTTALACGLAGGAAAQELNLYNWGNYTSPQLLEKFEAETGIHVTVTDYDSNDTALAKSRPAGTGSTSWCRRTRSCPTGSSSA